MEVTGRGPTTGSDCVLLGCWPSHHLTTSALYPEVGQLPSITTRHLQSPQTIPTLSLQTRHSLGLTTSFVGKEMKLTGFSKLPRSSVSMRRRSAANPPSYLPSHCQLPGSTALLHLLQTPTRKKAFTKKAVTGIFILHQESISFPCLSGEGETMLEKTSV